MSGNRSNRNRQLELIKENLELGLWSLKSLDLMKWFDIKNVDLHNVFQQEICETVLRIPTIFSPSNYSVAVGSEFVQYRTNLVKYLLILYILNHESFKCKCIFQVLAQIGVSNVLLEAHFWQYQNVLSDVLSMEFFTGSFNGWLPK